MVDVTDNSELKKLNDTAAVLNARFNTPVVPKRKAGRPKKTPNKPYSGKADVSQPASYPPPTAQSSSMTFPEGIFDSIPSYEESLFREAMVALMANEVRSISGLKQSAVLADAYVEMVKAKFG
jgi:hypothetical protein